MAQKNRSDLKAYSRSLIVESQISEEISPEDHNQVNDEMIDSLLNALDDLATADDFITLLSTAKKYLNPYIASLYFLRKSDKATQLEVIAGLNNSKYITPYGLTAALVGNYGIRDYNPDSLYAEGAGCFYDDGGGFRLYRCTNPDGTAGTFAPADWEAIGGAGDVLPNTWTTLTPAPDTIYLDCTDKNFPRFKSTLGTSDLTILIDYPEAILEGVLELHTTGATSGALLLDSFYAWIYNGGIISDYQLPDGTDKYYQFKFKYNAGIMYLEVTDGAGTGGGSFTETSQAQVEAAFDNTAIGTPTILETDKGVTPNKLWYFGQKIKTYVLGLFNKFELDLTFQNGGLVAKRYFTASATLTFMRKSSSISTLEYSLNSGSSWSSISAGTVSLAITATTEVWFRITYVTPTVTSEGIIYLEGTY